MITVNGAHVLAFDAGIDWDIKKVEGASGCSAAASTTWSSRAPAGSPCVSDGPPVMLEVDGETTFADPQAAITWSSGAADPVKTDVNMKTLIGRGSGETVQIAFSGKGWVLIQPSEGRVVGRDRLRVAPRARSATSSAAAEPGAGPRATLPASCPMTGEHGGFDEAQDEGRRRAAGYGVARRGRRRVR